MYGWIASVVVTAASMPQVDTTEAGAFLEGDAGGRDRFGLVTESGDVDGDGTIDLVVAAPHQTGGNEVHVFLGPHDLDQEHLEADYADITFTGPLSSELGWDVAIGDVIGDTSPDIVISAPSQAGVHGVVHVFEGPFSPQTLTVNDAALTIRGNEGGYLGWAIAAGDFDGDGKDELAAGAPIEGLGNPGAAYLFDLDVGAPADTSDATSRFDGVGLTGKSMANAGDMNGDGIEDLLIGSYGSLVLTGYDWGGAVSVVYGRNTFRDAYDLADPPVALDIAQITADAHVQNLGYSIASAGDLNADGYDDIIIGAPAFDCYAGSCRPPDRRGGVHVVLGAPDTASGGGTGRALHGSSRAAAISDVSWDASVDDDWTGISVDGAGYAGTEYSTWSRHPLNPAIRQLGPVLLIGTRTDKAYAIAYDQGFRFKTAPTYKCSVDAESVLRCVLDRNTMPPARRERREIDSLGAGAHMFVGDPGSAFGLEVLGPGDLDGDGDGDLLFGAPHQVEFEDAAGAGEAFGFPGR